MNERLKALQDKVLADAYQKQQGMDWVMEQLAELIIQECVDVLVDVLPAIVPDAKDGVHPVWHIKEHFGVEE